MMYLQIRHFLHHFWIYGGHRFFWSDRTWSIQGERYCWYCKKRQYFWFGIGGRKAGWYADSLGKCEGGKDGERP